jgi:O-acetyl-ADP-ribose deacetylase (regulator of RNase III)
MTQRILYVKGDATDPIYLSSNELCDNKYSSLNEVRIIVHICNDINKWGKGFVMALSSRWPTIDQVYHKYSQVLGTIQPLIQIKEDLFVCNMIAQSGISTKNGKPPIRYDALYKCLYSLVNLISLDEKFKNFKNVSIHMPRIGCGLAGGKWENVEKIIYDILIKDNIPVVVYDL